MPHIHDLIDFTVGVFIVYQDSVLLMLNKKYDMWLHVGGHVELDEDPNETLFREVEEECGLEVEVISEKPAIDTKRVKSLYPPRFLNIHQIKKNHKHIDLVYIAKAKNNTVRLSDEHSEYRWLKKEDLDSLEYNLEPAIKYYAVKALEIAQ